MRFAALCKSIVILLLTGSAAVSLTGCWSRRELNEVSIVVGMGIDKIKEGYRVSIQIVNPGEVTAGAGGSTVLAPVVTFEEEGKTVPEALRRMSVLSPRELQYSHLRIVVFGEKTARAGLRQPLDFLSRHAQMRDDFYLIIAKGHTAAEILKTYSSLDPIPANNLYTKLKTSDELWAATSKMTLNELIWDMTLEGKSAIMTGIGFKGTEGAGDNERHHQQISPSRHLVYSGTAVFKSDKLVGWLDEKGTKAINYVQDEVKSTSGFVECPNGGRISSNLYNVHSRTRVRINDGKPEIHIYIMIEQDVEDAECDMDFTQETTLEWMNREGEKKVAEIVMDTVNESKFKLGVDVLGLGVRVHRQQPKVWKRIKDWNEEFKSVPVYVHPKIYTRRIGTIQQPISIQAGRDRSE